MDALSIATIVMAIVGVTLVLTTKDTSSPNAGIRLLLGILSTLMAALTAIFMRIAMLP